MFCIQRLYQLTRAPVTKYRILEGLNNRKLFSQSTEGWKFKASMPAGLASAKASFFNLQMATFSLCPHIVFPHYMHISGVFPLIRTPALLNKGPILTMSLNYNDLLKGSTSRHSNFGVRPSIYEFGVGRQTTAVKVVSQIPCDTMIS